MQNRRIVLLAAVALVASTVAAQAGSSNSLMDISADGRLLACSNRDSGTVTIVDLATHTKQHEVPVGHKPEGVAFLGDTHDLAVAIYADDQVAFVDGEAGSVTGRVDVFDEPYGVVSTSDGATVYVTLEYPGRIVEIDAASRDITRTFEAGRGSGGGAPAGGGSRLSIGRGLGWGKR